MMRSILIILTLLSVLLAGCASDGDANSLPTTAPQPPTAEATAAALAAEVTETPVVIVENIPPAGTLVTAPATEDVSAGVPFDLVRLDQTGGITGASLTVEVYNDGRVVRDGVESRITPEEVQAIDAIINEIGFFGISGQFRVPGNQADIYYYKIYVERAGSGRMIDAQDGYTPDPLLRLINAVGALGAANAGAS